MLGSLAAIFLAACSGGGGFKRTDSGLLYKIISDGKGPVVKKGEFLKVNFEQRLRDSVLGTTYGGLPRYAMIDSVGPIYSPVEIFPQLRKGDSAVVVLLADTLESKQGGLPPFIHKGDKITLTFKVLDILATKDDVKKDQEASNEKEKQKEIQDIQDYLSKHNIQAQKTANGVFYVIDKPCDGPKADSGKLVSIHYTGYTLEGKYFDSNVDSTKQLHPHPMQPFTFQSGTHGAIKGMLDGIQQFNQGSKGRLFIPAMEAYGPQALGKDVKAFSDLVFDVEVIDVKDAPAAPEHSPGPPMIHPMPMPKHK